MRTNGPDLSKVWTPSAKTWPKMISIGNVKSKETVGDIFTSR